MEVWGGAGLVDVNSQLIWKPFFSQEQEQGRQLTVLLPHPPTAGPSSALAQLAT